MQTITIIEGDTGILYIHEGDAAAAWDAYEAAVGFGNYNREEMQADATTKTLSVGDTVVGDVGGPDEDAGEVMEIEADDFDARILVAWRGAGCAVTHGAAEVTSWA